MFKFVIAAVVAFSAIPAIAESPTEKTIIVDNTRACGGGRVGEFYQKKAMSKARALQREFTAQGYKVRLIKLEPGVILASSPHHLTINPAC